MERRSMHLMATGQAVVLVVPLTVPGLLLYKIISI